MNKRKKTNFFNYNKIYLFILLLFATLFSGCGANNEFSTYNGIIVDNPYSPKLNSYKGQLHCHSINSDGNNTPGEVVAAYKNAGYDFISITDHDYITADPNIPGITFINGVEETVSRHLTAYDVEQQSLDTDVQKVIDFHRNNNKLISIAHPNWIGFYVMSDDELNGYNNYNFIEVFNRVVNAYAETQWDYVLSKNKRIFGLSVDDCHNINGDGFDKGWIVLYADNKSKEEILNSLKEGNFYASTGNNIKVTVKNNSITATSSNTCLFNFISTGGQILKEENNVTGSEYKIQGNELYIRVKAINISDGTSAWSQPVFITK